jgi:hypothetical protein
MSTDELLYKWTVVCILYFYFYHMKGNILPSEMFGKHGLALIHKISVFKKVALSMFWFKNRARCYKI